MGIALLFRHKRTSESARPLRVFTWDLIFLTLVSCTAGYAKAIPKLCCVADFRPAHTPTFLAFGIEAAASATTPPTAATPAKWVVIINGCARFIIINEIDLRLLKLTGARLDSAYVTVRSKYEKWQWQWHSAFYTDIGVDDAAAAATAALAVLLIWMCSTCNFTFYIVADDISAVKPLWRYEVRASEHFTFNVNSV